MVEAEVVEEIAGTSVIAVRIMGILGVSLYITHLERMLTGYISSCSLLFRSKQKA